MLGCLAKAGRKSPPLVAPLLSYEARWHSADLRVKALGKSHHTCRAELSKFSDMEVATNRCRLLYPQWITQLLGIFTPDQQDDRPLGRTSRLSLLLHACLKAWT